MGVTTSNSDEISDEPFRRTLLSQVNHLVWLIDNAHLFGVSHVVQHGDQLTGTLIRASYLPQDRIKEPGNFRQRIVALVAALGVIAGVATNVQTVIGAGQQSVQAIERVVHEITTNHPQSGQSESEPGR